MFEGPFGQSPGRTKFAEPSRDIALRFYPSSEQQGPIHLPLLDLPPNAAYSQTRLDEGALWPVNWS
jgi:hypothetical protein